MLTSFDPLLIGIAIIVLVAGLLRLRGSWRMGRDEDRTGDWKGLLGYLFGHKKILKNRRAGIAHILLFWGVLFPLIVGILSQFAFTMPLMLARVLSFASDILGIAVLAGIIFFLVRRFRLKDPEAPGRVVFPAVLLLVIVLSGFFAEGARLTITEPAVRWPTPAGWVFAAFLPSSPLLMQLMVRVHFFSVLLFLCTLPFTFMRHLVTGPLNVYYRKRAPRGQLRQVALEKGLVGARGVEDFTWKQLLDAQACVSCGRCEENCPAFLSGKPLSPRKVIREVWKQMENPIPQFLENVITGDEVWACTTCMACVEQCPVYVEPMDKLIDMRRFQVMGRGKLPQEARPMIRDLEIYGDVNGKGLAHKEDWALNQSVPHISEKGLNAEILLWVGCSGAFHPRYAETTRALVRILKAGQVSFGILGKEELCCGDSVRRLGDEERFLELARKNIASFNKYHVKKIVCLCPHGFNILKNDYPALGGDFEVIHATQFVMELIDQKRISLKYPVAKKMAIHDPCYLGRVNTIYEPLRALAGSVPGIDLKELNRNREQAFCCGGGGGRMWLHENVGDKINHLRAREILENGVELVGTACPYCLTMLEDGINSLEMENPPGVMDMIEIVDASLGRVY